VVSSLDTHEEGGQEVEKPEEPAGPERALFVFTVAGVGLAVPALAVDAVAPLEELTPIPGAPSHIPGLVTAGDRVLPLVDLADFLDLGGEAADADPLFRRVLFVRDGDLEAGLVCGRARGLIAVAEASLREPSALAGGRLRPFLAAELDSGSGVVGVIDLGALLSAASVT
jgi:purine-binding chemotaxis protein CheW